MKHAEVRWSENYVDWAISNQAANSGRLNDYPIREYTASGWQWKRYAPALQGEDIV